MRFRNTILLLSLLFFLFSLFVWNYWRSREWLELYLYDISHQQEYIHTQAGIDEVLNSLEQIPFSKLPAEYVEGTHSGEKPFKAMLRGKRYYKVEGKDIYKKIIGHHRIRDFLPKDKYYRKHLKNMEEGNTLYLLLDKKLLFKFLELKQALKTQGYNSEGYVLRSVYRPPTHNQKVGGANRSKHILGEALDIGVRDINKDGRINQQDKEIVLDLLDKKIIRNSGGIGLYPNTMSVHFDVRGSRARWNTY